MYDWRAGKHRSMRGRTSCAIIWLFRKHHSTIVQLLCLMRRVGYQQDSLYLSIPISILLSDLCGLYRGASALLAKLRTTSVVGRELLRWFTP